MKNSTISQMTESIIENINFFVIPDEKLINKGIKKEYDSSQNVEFIPWFTVNTKNYITPNITPVSYSLITKKEWSNSLEASVVNKFEKIEKVQKIIINEKENIILIRVYLEMKKYDYSLMDTVLNEAEFPIKDMFVNKLIDFEYIPSDNNAEISIIDELVWKQIYNREVNNIILETSSSNFREYPFEDIPQVKLGYLDNGRYTYT